SSDSDVDLQQLILEAYDRLLVENYCIIASSALIIADYFFTLPEEIERIWRRRFTGATIIFFITRYAAVLERIVLLVSVLLPTVEDKVILFFPSRCVPVLRLDDTMTNISYLSFGLFALLRVRGIWLDNSIPLYFLALLTPIRPIISIYSQVHYTPIAFGAPLYGCGAAYHLDSDAYYRLNYVSRAVGIAIDITVIALTWYKTFGIKRDSRRLGLRAPYVTLLLRDGTLYFVVILAVQIFSIISLSVGSTFVLFDVWPFFEQVFTALSLYRFMLNLRGVYLADAGPSDRSASASAPLTSSSATWAAMRFVPGPGAVVGNMGAPL
ncbi:uncharacterized protein BXZ73DRAFT_24368, partial [Epithele typhae]|uniref:uncharacterized protein n=1 Tax=Epithele typhae TaxID=378194 RepID=UPI0020088BB2